MRTEIILAALVLFPFGAGLAAYPAGRGRSIRTIGGAALEFLLMAALALHLAGPRGMEPVPELELPGVCGFGLYFMLDGFRLVYGCVTVFLWLAATVAAKEYFSGREKQGRFYLFWFWTLGAVMGVFLSGDLYTTFIFFEIMSFTSYVWVVQEETGEALDAGSTYLTVAVAGGLVMLMGIFLLYHELGTLRIGELAQAARNYGREGGEGGVSRIRLYLAGGCLLFGFGAKAGMFPLHIWLPKAHPAAPAPASALLSGILTKTGIFGILAVSGSLFLHDPLWGGTVLALGMITMLLGAVLAVFSLDLKRTLACSSMSQIGFILTGIGMQGLLGEENALAVHGTLLHMVNHSMVKLLLFLTAGILYRNTHSLDLNRIRGFGRGKPLLAGIFLTGALCLGGIPGFGGYISKTLLHESIAEYGGGTLMKAAEAVFLFSGGLTIAYMTKLFVAIFVERNREDALQKEYDEIHIIKTGPGTGGKHAGEAKDTLSVAVLTCSALLLLIWGMFPHGWMEKAAVLAQDFMGLTGNLFREGGGFSCFSPENLKGALISAGAGALVYFFFIRKILMKGEKGGNGAKVYVNPWPAWLDLERVIYQPVLLTALPAVLGVISRILDCFVDALVVVLRMSLYHDSALPYERTEGNFLTAWLGRMLNRIQKLGNRTWNKDTPRQKDHVHLAAAKYEEIRENSLIIQRSLSFGLLLFGLGLVLTLAYLIFW